MFSFVIRTKNEAAFLPKVLEAIKKQQTKEKVEVIIVDSGSTDETIKIAQKYSCRIIKISPEEFTWGYALNIGIKNCKGSCIGIISGHCIPIGTNFISESVRLLSNDKRLAAVYGRQVGLHDMDPFEEADLDYFYPKIQLSITESQGENKIGVSNACCVLKKLVWDKVGFNEVVQSCEDGLWSEAVLNSGYKIAYTSNFGVYHSHKLNAKYLYKKSYWREYCPEYNKSHLHNPVYNFLKFVVKKNFRDYNFYVREFKKIGIDCSKRYILYYVTIINRAMMAAANDLAKHLKDEIRYEQIVVPNYIDKMQRGLEKEKFWKYIK